MEPKEAGARSCTSRLLIGGLDGGVVQHLPSATLGLICKSLTGAFLRLSCYVSAEAAWPAPSFLGPLGAWASRSLGRRGGTRWYQRFLFGAYRHLLDSL